MSSQNPAVISDRSDTLGRMGRTTNAPAPSAVTASAPARGALVCAASVLAAAGCFCAGTSEPKGPPATSPDDTRKRAAADAAAPAQGAPGMEAAQGGEVATGGALAVLLTDPELMEALERRGLSLAERLPGGAGDGSLAELADTPSYARIVATLESDLDELYASDSRAGVGMGHAHRLFDASWLRSPDARFELVGVVSRLDRRPFTPDACGEVRLVYRLAYTTSVGDREIGSRLPMTLTLDWLENAPQGGGCGEVAGRWQVSDGASPSDLIGEEGVLTPARLDPQRLHRLQINAQSIRFPSAVHPSLGGHAEYILRAFSPGPDGALVAEPLENTPDVAALRRDPDARDEILAWLRDPETLRRIDEGTAAMPAEYAAERAVSAAPRGLARRANRPFSKLFTEDDVADLDLSALSRVRSPAGLLRRLDDHSCAGCHQGRAVAGFHLLGEDRAQTAAGNALAVPLSPHALDETRRRRALFAAEARGEGDASYARPFSERDGEGRPGVYGTPCGLTGDPTFSTWDCGEGLSCRPYDASPGAPHVGICLPDAAEVGDPCEVGTMRSRDRARDDRVVDPEAWSCPSGAVCNTNRVGFPGGMCTTTCGSPGTGGRCGAIAVLEPFNACIARGEPFDGCLRDHVTPAGLRACDAESPCRHDYLCARSADGGVCIPPYFLFQMRVDGHPAGAVARGDP